MIEANHKPLFEAIFERYTRRALARAFHGVWVRGQAPPESDPIVFAVQHVSWWDPLVMFHLIRTHLPRARHFAMMDEANLRRFPFFRWIGAFGVDRGGASTSLAGVRYALARLRERGSRLVVFPQGRQMPMDRRPLGCARGTAWLAAKGGARVVPIALRYEFLEERWPDLFVSIGPARMCPRTGEAAEHLVESWMTEEANSLRDDVWAARLDRFTRSVRGRGDRDPVAVPDSVAS